MKPVDPVPAPKEEPPAPEVPTSPTPTPIPTLHHTYKKRTGKILLAADPADTADQAAKKHLQQLKKKLSE